MTLTIISLHVAHTEMATLYGISPEVEISAMIWQPVRYHVLRHV